LSPSRPLGRPRGWQPPTGEHSVCDALSHHCAALSRTDTTISAPGQAAAGSGQNAEAGRSTAAW
jgi:hypothetical protein